MRRRLRENGLSIVMFSLFLFAVAGQTFTGLHEYNDDQKDHGQPTLRLSEYLVSGHFVEATFENWESEFLQMAAYVVLTAFLYQKGSPESKDPGRASRGSDEIPDDRNDRTRRGRSGAAGSCSKIYENSLSLVLFAALPVVVALHARRRRASSTARAALARRSGRVHPGSIVGTSQFWFESFQNWQSEFLSVFVHGRPVDLPAPEGLAGVQAGRQRRTARPENEWAAGSTKRDPVLAYAAAGPDFAVTVYAALTPPPPLRHHLGEPRQQNHIRS